MIRKHIVFRGCVQGVGFRYRARCAADHFGCTGWVRNNWDDTVTMEIQGEEDQIDQVIFAIEKGRYVRIEDMEVKTMETRFGLISYSAAATSACAIGSRMKLLLGVAKLPRL